MINAKSEAEVLSDSALAQEPSREAYRWLRRQFLRLLGSTEACIRPSGPQQLPRLQRLRDGGTEKSREAQGCYLHGRLHTHGIPLCEECLLRRLKYANIINFGLFGSREIGAGVLTQSSAGFLHLSGLSGPARHFLDGPLGPCIAHRA